MASVLKKPEEITEEEWRVHVTTANLWDNMAEKDRLALMEGNIKSACHALLAIAGYEDAPQDVLEEVIRLTTRAAWIGFCEAKGWL